jgi:sporulation protein YlmC with PRC-barrel domain
MPSPLEVRDWHELDVFSSDGQPVGKLIDVYVNNESGEPEFLLVASGFLHNRLHLAPAEGATRSEDEKVTLAVTKAAVDAAPHIAADGDLSPDEERRLYDHYDMGEYIPHPGGLLIVRRWVLVDRG